MSITGIPAQDGPTLPAGVRRSHVEPLWDRIERNRLKVGAFIALFILAAAVSAAVIVGAAGAFLGVVLVSRGGSADYFGALPWIVLASLILGAIFAGVHTYRALSEPHRRLPVLFGATRSDVGTLLPSKSALHDMALAAGFSCAPGLWVIEECDRVNAFVLGLDQDRAVVGITRGFADRLSEDDQRAVFANLMARLCSGDVLWATVVSAIMGPIWRIRAAGYKAQEGEAPGVSDAQSRDGDAGIVGYFLLGMFGVVLTELLMAGHQRAALAAAEKADAEGMLLLRDPVQMLDALARVLYADNTVPGAGEEYSMLFYCWAGFGYAPEDDPEMERIPRLREVLGAEGMRTPDWVAPV